MAICPRTTGTFGWALSFLLARVSVGELHARAPYRPASLLQQSSDVPTLQLNQPLTGRLKSREVHRYKSRGFMSAGAPRVIASLWKVDDEATGELMNMFYRNLLKEHQPAVRALSAAQAEMRQQPRWRSPYYWGAFTLQGDWR
jgi:hypothetical protein